MGFKKGSIGAILMEDLNNLKKDREALIEELKNQYPFRKELELLVLFAYFTPIIMRKRGE